MLNTLYHSVLSTILNTAMIYRCMLQVFTTYTQLLFKTTAKLFVLNQNAN